MNQDIVERERRETNSRKQRAKDAVLECVHYLGKRNDAGDYFQVFCGVSLSSPQAARTSDLK